MRNIKTWRKNRMNKEKFEIKPLNKKILNEELLNEELFQELSIDELEKRLELAEAPKTCGVYRTGEA